MQAGGKEWNKDECGIICAKWNPFICCKHFVACYNSIKIHYTTKYATMTWQICSDNMTSTENRVVENSNLHSKIGDKVLTATPLLHCNLALILIHRSAPHLQLEPIRSQPPELFQPNTALRLLCELNWIPEPGAITKSAMEVHWQSALQQ